MDTHASGWSAFAAPTTDAIKSQVLYAVAPDGTMIEVFAVGDPALAPSVGTISGFTGVWVGSGFLLTTVAITGDASRDFAVLSATLAVGGASDKTGVIYDGDSLAGAGLPDTLDGIDVLTPVIEADGTFWFRATGTPSGDENLLSTEKDGTGLTARALVGGALPGTTLISVDAFSVEPTGTFYAIVADTTAGERRIYLRDTGGVVFAEAMQEGDLIPGTAEPITNIHKGGWLIVYDVGVVIWMAEGPFATDDVFLAADGTPAGQVLMSRSGEDTPLSSGGFFGQLTALNVAPECDIPQFSADVAGSAAGVTFGTYGHTNVFAAPVLGTDDVSNTTAGPMGATYPGLANPLKPYTEVSTSGSFLFANVLQSGLSAILWLIPGDRIYALTVEGQAGPGGTTYASLPTSAHCVADGNALFRVNLSGGLSAIMRQGP
jgi:hypothetical protein